MKFRTLIVLLTLSPMIYAADHKPETVPSSPAIEAPPVVPENAKKIEPDMRWREYLKGRAVVGAVCEKKNCTDQGLSPDIWDEHERSGLE